MSLVLTKQDKESAPSLIGKYVNTRNSIGGSRVGKVVKEDLLDTILTYKIKYDDGASPPEDWHSFSTVAVIEEPVQTPPKAAAQDAPVADTEVKTPPVQSPSASKAPPSPKKKGAVALLKGLKSGEVSKIVDKMEAAAEKAPPQEQATKPPSPSWQQQPSTASWLMTAATPASPRRKEEEKGEPKDEKNDEPRGWQQQPSVGSWLTPRPVQETTFDKDGMAISPRRGEDQLAKPFFFSAFYACCTQRQSA
jgi:hypothetical protein